MRTAFLIVSLLMLNSCTNRNNFKYVENIKEQVIGAKNVYHTKEEIITATNDTLAYIKAYSKYRISQALTDKILIGESNVRKEIISFQLFNSDGENITDINFKTKEFEQKKADSLVIVMTTSYDTNTGESSTDKE